MGSRSYSAVRMGPLARAQEFAALYRIKRRDARTRARAAVDRLDAATRRIETALGRPATGLDVLVVGPGQHLSEIAYWGRHNHVVGIDSNLLVGDTSWRGYLEVLRRNGGVRFVKTLGRDLSRVDGAYRQELAELLGTSERAGDVVAMDAHTLGFADGAFDCVYSQSVFEHLADPDTVMREIARVLRPGGVAYMDVHLYTSDAGCHDARIFSGRRSEIPYWSHLRPRYADRVHPNSYLNGLRLDDWRSSFRRHWAGVEFDALPDRDPDRLRALGAIRSGGELEGYTDEELLTGALIAVWRRPPARPSDPGSPPRTARRSWRPTPTW